MEVDTVTQIIFLAMIWGGKGPYTISQIIHVYDWINRAVPNREELEIAINTLLALDLLIMNDGKYIIPIEIGQDFEAFRKRNRKSKFKTVQMYFDRLNREIDLKQSIEISQKEYASELRKYEKFMES